MMFFKSLVASSLLVAASTAFSATPVVRSAVNTLDDAGIESLRVWSSVCVGNVDVEKTIAAKYRYGTEGDWTDVKFEKNVLWIFSERYTNDIAPYKITVKFLNKDGTDGTEMVYDLNQTETRFRPRSCDSIENYRFQKTDAPELTVDLVHVGQ